MNDYRPVEERKMIACKKREPLHENLSETMHAISEKAQIALKMANKINCHLFGIGNVNNADGGSPSCFAEELAMTDVTISQVCAELEGLISRLGV